MFGQCSLARLKPQNYQAAETVRNFMARKFNTGAVHAVETVPLLF